MKFIQLLGKDKKLAALIIGGILLTLFIPYITIPGFIIWWFYKKSKISKKVKVITTAGIGGLFTILVVGFVFAYTNDVEPHLKVTEPASTSTMKAQQVIIKGNYDPTDRKVWINGKEIKAANGTFESVYQLQEGQNRIEISAGSWKRADVHLTVTRELTDEEKAARLAPTSTPSPTLTPTSTLKTTSPQPTATPVTTVKPTNKPSPTPKPTDKPSSTTLEKINKLISEKYSNFDVTIYNQQFEFAKEGEIPYEIMAITNTTIYSSISCFEAKTISYNIASDLYNDPQIRPTISRVFVSVPGYLELSLGANDGVPMAEKGLLGGFNGPTNFWNTLVKMVKYEVGDMKNWTWGTYLTNCK